VQGTDKSLPLSLQGRDISQELIHSLLQLLNRLGEGLSVYLNFLLGLFFIGQLVLQSGDVVDGRVLISKPDTKSDKVLNKSCSREMASQHRGILKHDDKRKGSLATYRFSLDVLPLVEPRALGSWPEASHSWRSTHSSMSAHHRSSELHRSFSRKPSRTYPLIENVL
jgi:hypothetical protein